MDALADSPRSRWLLFGLGVVGLGLGLIIARAPILVIFGGFGAVGLVAGSLTEPLIGIGAALLLGPLRAWLEIVMPGMAPHVGQAMLLLAVGSWIVRGMLARRFHIPVPPLLCVLIAFLMMGLVSLWHPVDPWAGALEFLKWVQVLVVSVIVYDRVSPGVRSAQLVVALLAVSAVFQAAIGLWQFGLRGDGVEQFAIDSRFYRAYGTFQQPNPYAGLLGLVGGLVLGIAAVVVVEKLRSQDRLGVVRSLALLVVPGGIIAAGLLASWSRGGWMGFGAAMLVLVILLPKRAVWGISLVVAMAIGSVGLYASGYRSGAFGAIVSRLTGFASYTRFEDVRGIGVTDENFAVIERMAHWQAALEMWRDRFWRGVGLGCYEAAYPDYALINWPLPLGHAHNFYLNLLAEVGILGCLSYLVWLGSVALASVWVGQRSEGWIRGIALGLAAAWTHLAVHSLVDNLLVNNVHLHIGVLVGLTVWIFSVTRTGATSPPTGR